ncbi:MAG: glutathione S-transferase family protein [Geminicoccaceae bacterium]
MLTLYHAPQSRSSRIIWLLEELSASYDIVYVDIVRQDGSGGADPINPHPDKKVPALVHDDQLVTETVAITHYLTELYPGSPIAPAPGMPGRGAYLSWLAYYGSTVETVLILAMLGLGDRKELVATFRTRAELDARILKALGEHAFILGDQFSAVDILLANMGHWMRPLMPEGELVDDYLKRCGDRPALRAARDKDGR